MPPHLSRNRRPSIIGLSRSILRMEDEDVRRPLNDRYLNNPRRVTVSNETTRMKNYELFAASPVPCDSLPDKNGKQVPRYAIRKREKKGKTKKKDEQERTQRDLKSNAVSKNQASFGH